MTQENNFLLYIKNAKADQKINYFSFFFFFLLYFLTITMDKKTLYPTVNSPDVDVPPSYNEVINPPVENPNYRGEGSSSFQPSAPPSVQGEDEYARINYNNQYYYQSIPMPTSQHHQAPLERVRYIIKRGDQDERHFPINASLFLLGW